MRLRRLMCGKSLTFRLIRPETGGVAEPRRHFDRKRAGKAELLRTSGGRAA